MRPGCAHVTALVLAALTLARVPLVMAESLTPFSGMAPGEVAPPWRLQTIRGRPAASFRIVDRSGGVVEAVASGSVASLIHPVDVDPATAPVLTWRWRIGDAVEGSDLYRRSGDDFPARVYVLFDYDVARLPFAQRWKLRLARLIYGHQVPGAALCYVPAARVARETIAPNAYTGRVRMLVVDDATRVGEWRTFERNVVRDFLAAFGEPAPRIVAIAIAIDTDDTGETARAWFGDVALD